MLFNDGDGGSTAHTHPLNPDHVDGSCVDGGRVVSAVCLFFYTIPQKTDAARLTKLNVPVFHDESWKTIYFGVRRSKVKVTRLKKRMRESSDGVQYCHLLRTYAMLGIPRCSALPNKPC